MKWNELSMKEKLPFMQKAIAQGIIKPSEIEEHFNSFQNGGDTKSTTWTSNSSISGTPSIFNALNSTQPRVVMPGSEQPVLRSDDRTSKEREEDRKRFEEKVHEEKLRENLYKNQHIWQIDPTRGGVPKEAVLDEYNYQKDNVKNATNIASIAAGAALAPKAAEAYKGFQAAYKAATAASPKAAAAVKAGIGSTFASHAIQRIPETKKNLKEAYNTGNISDKALATLDMGLNLLEILPAAHAIGKGSADDISRGINEGINIAKTIKKYPEIAKARPGYLFNSENREAIRTANILRKSEGHNIDELLPRNMKDLRRIVRNQNAAAEESRQFVINKSFDKIKRGFQEDLSEGYLDPIDLATIDPQHPYVKHMDFDALFLHKHKIPLSNVKVKFTSERNYKRLFPQIPNSNAVYITKNNKELAEVMENIIGKRNYGKMMFPSEQIGYTTAHELGHGIQSRIPNLNNSAIPGLGYYVPNKHTYIGYLTDLATPKLPPAYTLGNLWLRSPYEIHSELWANRYKYRNLPVKEQNMLGINALYDKFKIGKGGNKERFLELLKELSQY